MMSKTHMVSHSHIHMRYLSVASSMGSAQSKYKSDTSVDTASHQLQMSKAQELRKQRRKQAMESVQSELDKGGLMDITIKEMENSKEHQEISKRLQEHGQKKLTREEKKQRDRALEELGLPSFSTCLKKHGLNQLKKDPIKVFQMNIGKLCNQACTHCHVESSPKKINEQMTMRTAERCMEIIRNSPSVKIVDITGGAPELNVECFRYLVKESRKLNLDVIDRCNLTVLSEPGQEDLAQFLADNQVHVIASLPCYG